MQLLPHAAGESAKQNCLTQRFVTWEELLMAAAGAAAGACAEVKESDAAKANAIKKECAIAQTLLKLTFS